MNQLILSSSSINFYITSSKSNLMIFEITDLYHQVHSIKIKVSRTKAFLNKSFDSNKKTHIEKSEKNDFLQFMNLSFFSR